MNSLATVNPMPLEERVRKTGRSDDGSEHRASKRNSNSAAVPAKTTPVSWADVVKGAGSTKKNERVVNGHESKNRVFREIILSKQSSVKE
jgi:hypothetical protein